MTHSVTWHRLRSSKQQQTFANMSMETLLSCFTQLFLSTGAKVPQERKLKGTKVVCGAKVPRVRKFHGTKVLGTFAPEERKFHSPERKFHGMKVLGLFAPRERMFLGTKVPQERKFSLQIWSFRCWERKCIGTKRPGFYTTYTVAKFSANFTPACRFANPHRRLWRAGCARVVSWT